MMNLCHAMMDQHKQSSTVKTREITEAEMSDEEFQRCLNEKQTDPEGYRTKEEDEKLTRKLTEKWKALGWDEEED